MGSSDMDYSMCKGCTQCNFYYRWLDSLLDYPSAVALPGVCGCMFVFQCSPLDIFIITAEYLPKHSQDGWSSFPFSGIHYFLVVMTTNQMTQITHPWPKYNRAHLYDRILILGMRMNDEMRHFPICLKIQMPWNGRPIIPTWRTALPASNLTVEFEIWASRWQKILYTDPQPFDQIYWVPNVWHTAAQSQSDCVVTRTSVVPWHKVIFKNNIKYMCFPCNRGEF